MKPLVRSTLDWAEVRDIASIFSICISRKKIKNVVRPTVGNKPPFEGEAASNDVVNVDSANLRRDRMLGHAAGTSVLTYLTPKSTTYSLESLIKYRSRGARVPE